MPDSNPHPAAAVAHRWHPLTDYETDPHALALPALCEGFATWESHRAEVENTPQWPRFLDQVVREAAIETGQIEGLYAITRELTRTLITHGLEVAHARPEEVAITTPEHAIALMRDQASVIEGLFDFVGGQRALSLSYMKEMHHALVQHQDFAEGLDQNGRHIEIPLLKGDFKRRPNNPSIPGRGEFQYCPPEHAISELERLLDLHHRHVADGVPTEVEAAWFHHRFVMIHPFQDGNGRMARVLSSLVFVRAGQFPLVVREGHGERDEYLDALQAADRGDLGVLVRFFGKCQQRCMDKAIALAADIAAGISHSP